LEHIHPTTTAFALCSARLPPPNEVIQTTIV